MKRNIIKQSIPVLSIVFLLFSDISVTFADDVLRIGIFPRRSVSSTIEMFTPLANHLGKQLGKKVLVDVPPDMPAFWSRMENAEYDLVHLNQYHYARAHANLGWQAILKNEEFGEDKISGALWVLKDSDFQTLNDLKGKLIVFGGGDHAMVASIMTKDILLKAGIQEEAFIGMSTFQPVKSIISVYYKQADAAGVGASVIKLPAIRNKIDVSKLRILAKSKALAHLPWAVSSKINESDKRKIVRSLLKLNDTSKGRSLLEAAGMTGIRVATDNEYDEHRLIIKRVLGEDYMKEVSKTN